VVLQLTVFWYIGAVLGHVCLGLGVLALVTMLLSWVFFFPQWGLGVCVVLWSVGCKSIQFLVHSFIHSRDEKGKNTHADK
jgi:membrane protein required for beta-lactamase induction